MVAIKYLIGALLIIAGVVLGLYLGIWVFFIGGIGNIADGFKANPTNAKQIAWGAAEVLFLAELVGWAAFTLCVALGAFFFGAAAEEKRSYSRNMPIGGSNRYAEMEWERRKRDAGF